jgi:4-amino-4-deoxy-L-arabinose transferase-like glycosyltransferase
MKQLYIVVVLFFSALLIFSDLGAGRMPPIDDCYYSQKAKEIIQTGDWLTIHYAGAVSIDNTPFYIWLIAIMFKFFGISEYSARFFSAFFGVSTILIIYLVGRMLFDEWIGILSSFVLLTTQLFFTFARRAMVDVTLTFCITLALFFFLKGQKKREYFILFGAAAGIGILTKSILGLFPILIAILYLIVQKQFKKIMDPFFLLGIAVAFLVSVPWFLYQYINYPENFLSGHLKWLIYERGFILKKMGSPAWYLKKLLMVYWPWLPLAAYSFVRLTLHNLKKVEANSLFVLCWTVVVIGMMSAVNDKKLHYIMPSIPALALLSALSLNDVLHTEKRRKLCAAVLFAVLVVTSAVIIITPFRLPPTVSRDNYFENLVEDTYSVAAFAREHLPQDEKIILYRIWLWRIKSTYLFYSDRDIEGAVEDKDELMRSLRNGAARYCLTTRDHFDELLPLADFKLEIKKETGSLILFKAV